MMLFLFFSIFITTTIVILSSLCACHTFICQNTSYQNISYLLITGKGTYSSQGEVLSQMVNQTTLLSSKICSEQYPLKIKGATGANTNGSLLVCGGQYKDTYSIIDECYIFRKGQKEWKFHQNMTIVRGSSDSIGIENMLWVTGG